GCERGRLPVAGLAHARLGHRRGRPPGPRLGALTPAGPVTLSRCRRGTPAARRPGRRGPPRPCGGPWGRGGRAGRRPRDARPRGRRRTGPGGRRRWPTGPGWDRRPAVRRGGATRGGGGGGGGGG